MDWFLYLIIAIILIAAGYVLRKYVEKKWPDQARLIDIVATQYGEDAAAKLRQYADTVANRDAGRKS